MEEMKQTLVRSNEIKSSSHMETVAEQLHQKLTTFLEGVTDIWVIRGTRRGKKYEIM
jgi:hypothetical protein